MTRLRFAIGLATIVSLHAQSFTGSILGTVKDPAGAVVPGAALVVTNTGNNARANVQTDATGNYAALLLQPGLYKVEASAAGFKKFLQEGITLQVQQQARVDIVLPVGEVSESVTVSADAALLDTSSSTIGKVVDNKSIVNLPLNTRNVYSLIFLTPGVAGTVGNNYGEMRYSVNGARARQMDTLIDGVSASHATVTGFSGISVFPSVDAIEEFKVMGANYPAEFGRSMGSVLNVVFKSGTNQLHGSAYEFLRNSIFDANNFFDNRRGATLNSFKRSQYGGTFSGPIRRDKTFFMTSYEGLRERRAASTILTVPTAIERTGDFSQTRIANGTLIQIFDPFSTRSNGAGGFVRDAFAGNRIPAARMDPVALNSLKYYPQSNTPGSAVTNQNNFANQGSAGVNLDQWDVKIDHILTGKQRLFGRYSKRDTDTIPAIFFPKDTTIAEGRVIESDKVHGAVADYTNTLSPTMILNARLGFARTLYLYANQGLGFSPSTLGFPKYLDQILDIQMFPRIAAGGYVSLGGNGDRHNAFNSNTALANLTKIKGKHSVKFGFEGRLHRVGVAEFDNQGVFGFSATMTQGPNPNAASATAGNGFASMLLGVGSSGNNLIQNFKNVETQNFYVAWYVQDDWRVTSKLTLNLGIRYDYDTPRTERFNRTNYFDPTVASPLGNGAKGGLIFVGVNGSDRHQYNWDLNNLAPRIGLAYQANSKTVVRLGYGNIFGQSQQAAHGTIGTTGWRLDNQWVNSIDGVTPFNLLRDPYPTGFRPLPGAADGLRTGTGGDLEAVIRETPAPLSMQWNANIQRELRGQIMIETAYVGTRGLQLHSGIPLNQLTPDRMALGAQLNQLVDNPFFGKIAAGALANRQVARGQLLRPFPQFNGVGIVNVAGASSTYHSWQNSVSKRFSRGLMFEGSYTWSKMLDNGTSHQNAYDILASRSLSDLDISHRFVISYIYELPFGRGRRYGASVTRLVDTLLGGWQLNGFTNFQTGSPLSFSASNTAGLFGSATRPNNSGKSGKLDGPVDQRLNSYFDKSVFSQPAPFTFGNVGPRAPDIRSDGTRNWDVSLFKDFRIVERLRLQFRGEFLNAFNTPRFGNPNTNVTSSSVGVITSQANAPRQIQFGMKLLW
ncbi:MAG: hypothetical protein EXQ52_12290 [Bryobacterales bacterium]|nr:hypothetical protein [Bryobacterales bacterium]